MYIYNLLLKKILGFLATLIVFCWIGSLVFEEVYGEVSDLVWLSFHCVMALVHTMVIYLSLDDHIGFPSLCSLCHRGNSC